MHNPSCAYLGTGSLLSRRRSPTQRTWPSGLDAPREESSTSTQTCAHLERFARPRVNTRVHAHTGHRPADRVNSLPTDRPPTAPPTSY